MIGIQWLNFDKLQSINSHNKAPKEEAILAKYGADIFRR